MRYLEPNDLVLADWYHCAGPPESSTSGTENPIIFEREKSKAWFKRQTFHVLNLMLLLST